MKNLKRKLEKILITFSFIFFLIYSLNAHSDQIAIEIKGNEFTDEEAIISLLEVMPSDISEEYSNYVIKTLNNSLLFENVSVELLDNKYLIIITEYPNINKIKFKKNERFKDEELEEFINEFNLTNINPYLLEDFIEEMQKLYQSFGYNNSKITYTQDLNVDSNTADLIFVFSEGDITKIKNIKFKGNDFVESADLKSIINSKTKTLLDIFANNNFKKFLIENDTRTIKNYYRNKGFVDAEVDYIIEYLKSNKVNITFNINEGDQYQFKDISFMDKENLLENSQKEEINLIIKNSLEPQKNYSRNFINDLKDNITDTIFRDGIEFYEIETFEKKEEKQISVLFNISSIDPRYTNQINIYGNSRTLDKVIRRELSLYEGDAVYKSQIQKIQNKLRSLGIFESVEVSEKEISKNLVDIEIFVEEKQTGTLNAGVSFGTIDGLGIVAGLSERNFYGTGRALNALVNTTNNRTQFTLETTDKLYYASEINLRYGINFKQEDFSVTSSYELDTFTLGAGIAYKLNPKLKHTLDLDYLIKDYKVTNESTVASAIKASSGQNISFIFKNNLIYSTLKSTINPKNGNYLSYTNAIETPTSSSNGTLKNIVTYKKFKQINKNILSLQLRLGNILSLNDNDILTDDKFSLGGKWLRGFDSYGAGPRNSRTSYVGGNNLFVSKFDFSRQIFRDNDFPVYINLFNDYGMVWENKSKPTNSDNSLRASAGFGIKYYSPIGPIGFSWGFPLSDESYDIKRMFLFSIGNID
tara:strand:- start:1670 stop:3937 length:2268 start_codon:yes stop_codon:yes gene_type:complete